MNKMFKLSFPDTLRLIQMVPVLKKVESLDNIDLLPRLCYGASFDQFITVKTSSKIDLHIMCRSGYIFLCQF